MIGVYILIAQEEEFSVQFGLGKCLLPALLNDLINKAQYWSSSLSPEFGTTC